MSPAQVRADEAADLIVELLHGRDRSELAAVLKEALNRGSLDRLIAFGNYRLGRHPDSPQRRALIEAGLLRPR